MTTAEATAKKNNIMDRIAAVKGTSRQALEGAAHEIAERTADICDGTWEEAMEVAEKLWTEYPGGGIAWSDVEAAMKRLYR